MTGRASAIDMTVTSYDRPSSLREASDLLRGRAGIPIAGRTDVLIRLRRGAMANVPLVNLKGIPGLAEIAEADEGLRIGSGASLSAVAMDERVRSRHAGLAQGALSIGTPQIRNLGTIGGNVCNASPCADTAPGLLIAGADVEISDDSGTKRVAAGDFWKGPGKTVLEKGEIVTAFLLPSPKEGARQGFLKLGPRRAADIAVVNLGMSFMLRDGVVSDVRIALGSVAPTPLRAAGAEAAMEGKRADRLDYRDVGEAAARDAAPISDVRGSEWYRREAVAALVEELLAGILGVRRG